MEITDGLTALGILWVASKVFSSINETTPKGEVKPADAIERQLEKLHDVAESYKDDDEDVPEWVDREISKLHDALTKLALEPKPKEIQNELRSSTDVSAARNDRDAFNYK